MSSAIITIVLFYVRTCICTAIALVRCVCIGHCQCHTGIRHPGTPAGSIYKTLLAAVRIRMYFGCSHSAGICADIVSRPSEAVEHPLIVCLYILAYAGSSQYKLQSYAASGKVRIGRVLTCISQVGQQSCTVGGTAFSKIQIRSV